MFDVAKFKMFMSKSNVLGSEESQQQQQQQQQQQLLLLQPAPSDPPPGIIVNSFSHLAWTGAIPSAGTVFSDMELARWYKRHERRLQLHEHGLQREVATECREGS